ncbi:N-acetyltransferase [Vibrio owensii]|uniref:N-acetyltransferase n=1 Tax=Vibrio owensii TaxID=696485 RepID=A0AAP9GAV7_9VIBR|nr:acyltransferase [Vibrio owensii]AYO14027.1 N-acetyltransferase [Vibrio owensii]QGH46682.1 N-acetyltransferase [Vibrio owensii]
MYSPKVLRAQIKDVTCGENVTIIEPANVYGCELKEGVFVGPFVEIQKNTVIGERTKIQSHTFICEYVTIGSDCFVGHGVMFANDLFKDGKPDVNICEGVVIGAGSVVTKDITEKGIYAGNPAKKLRDLP